MKFGYVSWLPQTEFMNRFIEELKNDKLLGTHCKKCGAKYLPPRDNCVCGSKNLEWYEAPKKGQIIAYTIVTFPPESMEKYAPYIVAIAELEDKTKLLAHLSGVTPKNLEIGLPIQVVSYKISEDKIVYKFKPTSLSIL